MSVSAHCKPNHGLVGVYCDTASAQRLAASLATELALPLLTAGALEAAPAGMYLHCDHDGIALCDIDLPASRVRTAFAADNRSPRTQGKQLLIKAIGGGLPRPSVLDATCGLGRDAALLHAFDFPLTLLERDPVLHAMLAHDLNAAEATPALIHADARDWLANADPAASPDVIYLDPMFAAGKGNAAVKKELQFLRDLLVEGDDGADLLALAEAVARYRVVVKRAAKAPPLAGRKPGFSVSGKAIRFDVYPLRAYPRGASNADITPS